MKKTFLPLLAMLIIASCSNSTNSNMPASNIILNNFTFDSSGHPSLGGWIYGRSDVDSAAHYTSDVPPGSIAKWSVSLSPGWIPFSEFIHREFTGLSGGIYQLTFWEKVTQPNGRGSVLISSNAYQPWHPTASIAVSDTTWTHLTLLDTLAALTPGDTISLVLTGGSTEVANWHVLYNNITFQKLP